jgi:hypothetical protein
MTQTLHKLKSSSLIDTITCATVTVAGIGGWVWFCASIASPSLLPLM